MNLFHKTALGFYNFSWNIVLPWLRFNHRLAEGYHQRALRGKLPDHSDLWIQAASVGESFLALEVLKTLETKQPIRILLTSNTRQGIEILNHAVPDLIGDKNQIQTAVRFFPFDKPSIMAQAVASIRPKLMVLLETEIWPGLLQALKTQGCKIIIINGRITEKSLQRYHLWPSVWQTLRPDKILAISPADADRFGQLFGPDGIEVMANIKFDRIIPSKSIEDDQTRIKSILTSGPPFVVLASVRHQEESQVINIIREIVRNRPQTVMGLFPRHMHRIKFWQQTLTQLGIRCALRSTVSNPVPAGTVILWDTFGELMLAYRLAQTAFVGGSLAPLGGQNFLEALISGVIPVIGPSWENFAWIGQEIIEAGLLRVADDWRQVAALILQDMDKPRPRTEVIEAVLQFVETRRGGTTQACRQIEAMLFEE
ncbi:MAG: 3-deoxy-D-manno-octulosonic acid transferase [Deltaproteobacteria bacterium]|nr:3-deoxy-D-manno-octulosonic acid transferase [Deltaproteobacteria bacterium]